MATRFLLASMAPLALGVGLDTYVLARVILGSTAGAATVAGLLFLGLVSLWFVFPRWMALRALFVRAPIEEPTLKEPGN